jgi:hypothetical protein
MLYNSNRDAIAPDTEIDGEDDSNLIVEKVFRSGLCDKSAFLPD